MATVNKAAKKYDELIEAFQVIQKKKIKFQLPRVILQF